MTESIPITTKPTKQNKKSKIKIKCDFDGCGRQFTTLNALRSHQYIAEHLITHSVGNEETTTTTLVSTTDKPKKVGKTKKVICDFDGCGKPFKNLNRLKNHQLAKHSGDQPVINEKTMISASMTENSQKTSKITEFICDFDACEKPFRNLSALGNHQLATHPTAQSVINEETPTPASTTEKPKKPVKKTKVVCDFNGCGRRLKNLNALKNHQLAKHSGDQPVINEKTMISASMTENSQKTSKITEFICDFDACEKTFRNLSAFGNHQLATHPTAQSVINEETPTSASTTEKPKKAAKKPKIECGFDDCRLSFGKRGRLRKHRIETHPIPLRCLFSDECLGSHERYLGILNLQDHIILQHTDSFRERICPVSGCKSPKLWHDWSAALQHILQRHTEYLLG